MQTGDFVWLYAKHNSQEFKALCRISRDDGDTWEVEIWDDHTCILVNPLDLFPI